MATVGVRHHTLFIDGAPADATEQYEIRSPATEELVCTVARGGVAEADAAVEAARRAHASGVWAKRRPDERAEVLERIADRLGRDLDEFVELETSANGATVRQATGFHVGLAAPHLLHFAALARTYAFERLVPTSGYPTMSKNAVVREPIGVCAAIVPWNFPLVLGLWKIGPALAAGNTVVVKADERAPLTLLRLAEIAHEEGLPAGVLNVITGDGPEVGARLASHPGVGKVAFTGSTRVGREIMRLASGTVKRISLELGGKSAAIVRPDADLDVAVDGILFGSMLYSGQMCESGTRLLVCDELHDEVVDRLVERASTITLGDPSDFETDMGPVISAAQRDRTLRLLAQAAEDGAVAAIGGGVPTGAAFERGHWITPTILTGVTNDMEIAREEVFGPVLSVLRYRGDDEAVRIANDCEYGLAGGIWSTDAAAADDLARRLETGTVWINTWHAVDAALPFGGHKQSGLGHEIGPDALDHYTDVKHIHHDLSRRPDELPFSALLSTPAG